MRCPAYRSYMLIVLMFVWAFNAVDINALGLVMQSTKVDLHLSDTQLGVLTGIAFALFYSIMGIPLARWADRGNRATILSLSAAIWSILVSLCGTAANFTQLMLLRIGVGVGEAGCMPASQSLIADFFTRAERPRAMAIFLLGDVLCMFFGLFVAGWLNELYGWRVMFVILGLPGLALAALMRFTFREPRLVEVTPVAEWTAQPSLREVCVTLFSNTTFRHLALYFSVATFFSAGIMQWQPSFLIRSFGLQTGELGTWLALINGLSILVGRYGGGEIASRLVPNDEQLQLKWMAMAFCISGVFSTFIYITQNRYVAFGFIGLSLALTNMVVPSTYALLQTLVPERMRAIAVATVFFIGGLIGNGLGPLASGALSDALRPRFGEDSLRYALLALCPGCLWGAWYLWRASQTVVHDLQRILPSTQLGSEAVGAPDATLEQRPLGNGSLK